MDKAIFYHLGGAFRLDYCLIAEELDASAYLSFETALSRAGILSQAPYALTLATKRRSRKILLGDQEIVYRRLKDDLYGDYEREDSLRVASAEKALLDSLYLICRGRMTLPLDELDMGKLDKKRLDKLAKKFPIAIRRLLTEIKKNQVLR